MSKQVPQGLVLKDRIYFPGLNGIRFLAALSVVIVHIEQFKGFFGLTDRPEDVSFFLFKIALSGRDAVTLFFVLSGFLITYLLLSEYQLTGTIAVRKFYLRRVLRIWPLYYLIVFISFVIIPLVYHATHFDGYYVSLSDRFFPKLALMVFFLPNVADLLNLYVVGAMHLWSIGIEEQFYLLWPVLLKRFARNALACLLSLLSIKLFFILLNQSFGDALFPPSLAFLRSIFIFIINFRIESMAIGGLGAYLLLYKREDILRFIFHPVVEKTALGLMILNATVLRSTGLITDALLSVVYILFILNVSSNPRSTVKLENRFWNAVGKFSYGVYMFHPAIIYILMIGFHRIGFEDAAQPLYNPVIYTLVIGLTVGVSALSYHWFEMPFLRLKSRLAVIESGEKIAGSAGILDRIWARISGARRSDAAFTQASGTSHTD